MTPRMMMALKRMTAAMSAHSKYMAGLMASGAAPNIKQLDRAEILWRRFVRATSDVMALKRGRK